MQPHVTQKDIAEATGLNQSTISLALRGDPRVNEETREKILKISRDLGYRKDPMLTALASYRDNMRQTNYRGTLAWLCDPVVYNLDYYEDSVWNLYREGALEQATQHGYNLEVFEVDTDSITQQRLSNILYHRGIEGVVLPPLLHAGPALKLDWERFAVVTFGWSVTEPRFHSVSPNHYQNSIEIVNNLHTLGYRRIAVVLMVSEKESTKLNFRLSGHGVEMKTVSSGLQKQIPTLYLEAQNEKSMRALHTWYRKHQPDALAIMKEGANFILDSLKEIDVQAPRDVGVATFFYQRQMKDLAGINENSRDIGKAAVDILVGTIRRREFGVPNIRRMLQIEGVWQPAKSVREQSIA
ncbi:LacI family DNA-binding transcriptional regulator [Cerasicoccus frondis]|uniref:LacI family DNA-binding transcriptional regulator n=1 Tax=Cerasicoccus frondis TaxID=490090 RepID=UPI0028526930|nr:LacI family DNA-binding transcriptional regulator [Cerasicoccus frondis]